MTTAIDLSQLPAPSIIEALDFEQILAQRKAYIISLWPSEQQADIAARLALESDPLNKLLQESAFRETLLRQRINDAARGVMLAYATGADLDQLGARDDIKRLLITAGNPTALPPVAAVYESDTDYRRRIQLSPEGYTTAGSVDSYVFHALSAAAGVADASAVSPAPGNVTVYVLSRTAPGAASEELLAAVRKALNAENVRPMTDLVTVQSASIVTYAITAQLVMLPGPDANLVRLAAQEAAQAYAAAQHVMRRDVTLSGIYAALHQPGVQRVELASPAANLTISNGEASYCTAITITIAGATDV